MEPEPPIVNQVSPRPHYLPTIIIILLAVLLFASLGWNVYNLTKNPAPALPAAQPQAPEESSSSSLFNIQTASITGKITAVNGNRLTVVNNQDVTGDVDLGETITIRDLQNPTASPSSDLKSIKPDQDAIIHLEFKDGKYIVTLINYLASPSIVPAPPNPATPGGTQSPRNTPLTP
jgi:hypothetical protein